ncbi:MAG: fatty acid desaturase [Hyphomicrobiaceae bacterium]
MRRPEWPTVAVAVTCYAGFTATALWAASISLWVAAPILTVVLTLHSSLQHEIIHGHPFRNQRCNDLLGFLPIGLFVPFERFRDTHLAHHHDSSLTDPHDDPESNYVDPVRWNAMPWVLKRLLLFNSTLLGRMAVGPAISLTRLYWTDLLAMKNGEPGIGRAYLLHGLGLIVLAICLWHFSTLPFWLYVSCAYFAMSLLKIRTYLEHCANADVAHRTVIVEDRGLLSLLFLNNNLHAVHHAHPGLPWYALPERYHHGRSDFLRRNNGYAYPSYNVVIRRHFLRPKDPIVHPLSWPHARRAARSDDQRTRHSARS